MNEATSRRTEESAVCLFSLMPLQHQRNPVTAARQPPDASCGDYLRIASVDPTNRAQGWQLPPTRSVPILIDATTTPTHLSAAARLHHDYRAIAALVMVALRIASGYHP